MNMTWREIAEKINSFTDEQKDTTVAVYDRNIDEYFGIAGIGFCDDGVLEDNDPFIIFPQIDEEVNSCGDIVFPC